MTDKYPPAKGFGFFFPEGMKHESEMTRDDLLRVIGYQQRSIEFWKAEAHKSLHEWAHGLTPKRTLFSWLIE